MHPSKRSLLQESQQVIRKLESLGLRVHPSSRFRRFESLLSKSPDNSVDTMHPEFGAIVQGYIDIQCMGFALDFLPKSPTRKLLHKVRECAKGPGIAQVGAAKKSGARDYQVELYWWAVLSKAGFVPELAEPDLRFSIQGERWGLACKRITTLDTLEEAVRGARRQIDNSRLPGIIALDLTTALNAQKPAIGSGETSEEVGNKLFSALAGVVKEYQKSVEHWARSDKVRGLFLVFMTGHSRSDGKWALLTLWGTISLCNDHREESLLECFGHELRSGFPDGIEVQSAIDPTIRDAIADQFAKTRR